MKFFALKWSSSRKYKLVFFFFLSIYFLAILQDFVESVLRSTGFYISESAVFNIFWLLFLPGIWLVVKFNWKWYHRLLMPVVHVLGFTTIFVFISFLSYETPHRFQSILETVVANLAFLAVLIYLFVPMLFKGRSKEVNKILASKINIKKGKVIHRVDVNDIHYFQSDKPYVRVVTSDAEYLHNDSLKSIKGQLVESDFVQLGRSILASKRSIVRLESKGNGDYTAILTNGERLKVSRHFRKEWEQLLHLG